MSNDLFIDIKHVVLYIFLDFDLNVFFMYVIGWLETKNPDFVITGIEFYVFLILHIITS